MTTSSPLTKHFISIAGLIGAGKSTLATELGAIMHLPVYYEPVEQNPYLELFYGDMAAHGFAMQIYLLNERFRQQQTIVWQQQGAVQDRSIYEDSVFAGMLRDSGKISELNYQTYMALFNNMSNYMRHPTLIVYLYVTPEQALERIRQRSRGCEAGVTIEYLRALFDAYERFIREISKTIMVIRVDNANFPSASSIAAAVQSEYERCSNIARAHVSGPVNHVAPPQRMQK